MKRISFLLMLLVIISINAIAQTEYPVSHGADVRIQHSSHYPKSVSISGTHSKEQVLNNIASSTGCPAYFDKTSTVFTVKAGETVTPNITINGDFMHGYVYVDWNNNKQFDVKIEGTGPYTKGSGNELMCWSLYGHNTDGDSGWNSNDEYLSSGNVLAPGSFKVPTGLTDGSTFRMRYKVEWNSINAAGEAGNKFITDGGSIIDVTLKVSGTAEEGEEIQPDYPLDDYEEPRLGTTPNSAVWNKLPEGLQATWGSRDIHYSLHEVPQDVQKNTATIYAWKGERANIQAVLYSKNDEGTLSVRMTEWKKDNVATGINNAKARFVNYVITDNFDQCGNNPMTEEPWLVADVINIDAPHKLPAMETRPVWCTIEVPRDAAAGKYVSQLEIVDVNGNVINSLTLNINVVDRQLPTVADQKFHLDFWQQPYAVSRYHKVARWSDEHIEALRPYLEALGRAGQRTVSAIMFYEPWGEQTHVPDRFDPMIQTTLDVNGNWKYNYDIFDKYVELCQECGISKQINCFSMVPWDMSFRYYDEATKSYKTINAKTSDAAYRELWTSFLTEFKKHLIAKGWFEKTNIAMDERQESDMLNAYNIANELGFKMALAGNYHSSLCDKLQDFCVALGQDKLFTADQLARRKANNQITTIYTSCADQEPNIYTNSYPAEATFLPIYAAANNIDGYLHWAWINWDEDPLIDSRYRKFGSGDTYCYYPGNRSSVRFERLIEGIHQYEKIQILREEYKNDADKLKTLNALLSRFVGHGVSGEQCAKYVNDLESFLNGNEVAIPEPTDVKTGYYHIVCKDAARAEHIYNNALHSGNSNRFTLQSNSAVNTNNGIWHITVNGNKLTVKNGDGNPMVAGANWGSSVAGTFKELTVGKTADFGEFRYYYFSEAINCTNGGANFKLNGCDFITTWADGPNTADDNLWRFEPVDIENAHIYNVVIEGDEDIYVSYTHGATTENAFNGGFFIATNEISTDELSAGIVGNILTNANVEINGNTIKVSNVEVAPEPEKIDLYNTSNGGKGIPPYRIPGITTAHNGRLITAAARLVCGTDPGYGQVDVVCRTSDDNGKTWSPMKDVAVGTGKTSATENYFDTAFGDPAIVADRTSNEVLIIAVAGCTVYAYTSTNRNNPNMIAAIHSLDNGETWEKPVDITEQVYGLYDNGNYIDAAFVGGGKIFQSRIVKTGKYYRLYAAMCARPNGNRVIYSDDFGRTWKALGGEWALPAPGGDEPKCEELPDGRVILSSRVGGGGRIYNIFTYSNTANGEGEWDSPARSFFEGSGQTPGSNSTNGEIIIVPVQRNSDKKEMYLALQSLPTGNQRVNVGIFYKELTNLSDINSSANFAKDWDGFYQVSNTSSAYSSIDLQADNKIGFIYEETLTFWEKVNNPVSTTFPNGEGQHNYDGFDNIYVAYDLEYITNSKYSVKKSVDRRAYVQNYFRALAVERKVSDELKADIEKALDSLSKEPSTVEIDNINALFAGEKPADKWDGKQLTFTNVQKNGTEYTLYIDSDNTLQLSDSPANELGTAAQFICKLENSGKYSFFNEEKELYLIWRGNGHGFNNDSGTLTDYNATYCDWSINDGSASLENSYYIQSKRGDGNSDGTIIVLSNGNFDAWSSGVGYSDNYSNLFRIDATILETGIEETTYSCPFVEGTYDLQGRRVENPKCGIYIINGNKVLVR